MGNRTSSTPSPVPQVNIAQRSASRRNSEYRNRAGDLTTVEGRRWSTAVVSAPRSMSIKPKRLSPRQRNLIIKSWSRINKLKLAKDAFIEIFKASDFVRTKFVFGELTLKKIRQDNRFVAHCERFISALDQLIAHLDEIGAVIENAEELGRKHANMVKGISHQHWQMFIDILMDRIIENGNKQFDTGNEVSRAWKMLGQLVAFHIRLGYDHETLRSERSKRLLPMLPIQQANIDRNHLHIPDCCDQKPFT